MLNLTIKTGNAAFMDDNGEENDMFMEREVARILREVANQIEYRGVHEGNIMDINGNKVGSYTLE